MSNLLEQTLDELTENGKTPSDVIWVGSMDGSLAIDWQQFEKIANVDYDSGYGGQEIAKDLVVVGSDWWLERCEYDGSEWWEFNSLPIKSNDARLFDHVKIHGGLTGWKSLEKINE